MHLFTLFYLSTCEENQQLIDQRETQRTPKKPAKYPCSDIYCRPYTYCRRRHFMPVLLAHIVALKHKLSPSTIYVDIDYFFQANGATIYALNFGTCCRRQQNIH